MNDIYTLLPVNKSTAMTVNQSGCTSHNGLSRSQRREVLVARRIYLGNRLMRMKKDDPRRCNLGKEQHEIDLKLSSMNKRKGVDTRDLCDYIVDIIKPKYTKHQWKMIVEEAIENKKKNNRTITRESETNESK